MEKKKEIPRENSPNTDNPTHASLTQEGRILQRRVTIVSHSRLIHDAALATSNQSFDTSHFIHMQQLKGAWMLLNVHTHL